VLEPASRTQPSTPKATHLLPPEAHTERPVPLRALVVLGARGEELSLAPLEAVAAVPVLMPSLIYGGTDRVADAFAAAAALADRVPAFRCSLPDDVASLAHALEQVLERVTSAAVAVPR
jgi:hypothetical protein